MKFDVGVPSGAIKHFVSWVGDGDLADFAVCAEEVGFDSVHVTDHPFPNDSWLSNGGHQAFDPFVALSLMASVTNSIRLRTNLLVSGYRHPFVMARSIASLDVLSHGRVITGMGAGYLKAEFEAIGADFSNRGRLFDEAIDAMKAAWSGESVSLTGEFAVEAHTMLPAPAQTPHPPIWIGGNSAAAKRRAATMADGWIPMAANPTLASITLTAELTTIEQLAAEIRDVAARRDSAGISAPFDVAFSSFGLPSASDDPNGDDARAVVQTLEDAGVTWMTLPCRGRSLDACRDELAWLGENVISPYNRKNEPDNQ
jgi:probable F420-dependent oxidoreductase